MLMLCAGPMSSHMASVIHASYKPLGSANLTFGTFLQVCVGSMSHALLLSAMDAYLAKTKAQLIHMMRAVDKHASVGEATA